MFQPDPNTVVQILLTDIIADEKWNCRSGKWELNDGDDEAQQFEDLVQSIVVNGQEEPVDVRHHPTKPGYYLLTAGFRRHRAIQHIATKDPNTTIRCIVRESDNIQARVRNLSENACRQNITTPDLAWGLAELQKTAIAEGQPLTVGKMAALIGKSESYVGHLLAIMTKCKPAITKKWRSMSKNIGVHAMYMIALLPKADQDAAFAALLVPIESKNSPECTSAYQKTWVDSAKRKAFTAGILLGQLESHGFISTDNINFGKHIHYIVALRDSCTSAQRESIAGYAYRGYQQGKQREAVIQDFDE